MRIRTASVALAFLFAGGIARADPTGDEPSESERAEGDSLPRSERGGRGGLTPTRRSDEAGARFREGLRLFAESDFPGARAAFEAAYRTLPNALVLANIADCLVEEGRPADAAEAYRRFLEEAGRSADREARDRALARIALVRPAVCDLLVVGGPAGAEVAVDGRSVGDLPMRRPVAVEPGAHFVDVEAPGHRAVHGRIEAQAGEEVDLRVTLEPIETGHERSDRVTRHGPSRHAPEARLPARGVPLGRGPLVWTGVAATAVLVTAATVTGLVTLSREQEYSDPATSPARRRELWATSETWPLATDVLIDAAVVVGLATAALWIWWGPRDERRPTIAWRLDVGDGGTACVLGW